MTDELAKYKRRPGGISFLCFVLAWLCLAGLGNAWFLATGRVEQLPPWLSFVAALYGITAGIASVGLWHMRYWGMRALTACMTLCGVLLICFIVMVPRRLVLGGYPGALVFMVIIGFALVVVDRYVRRCLAPYA